MYLEFYGASEGVTGSLHRIHVNDADVLLDCGMFQGRRAEANAANRETPDWAAKAQSVVLSHAHLDHSGNIPTLVKRGFTGNVYCTPATRDLCSVMLRDAAMIQEGDARYLNEATGKGTQERTHRTPLHCRRCPGCRLSHDFHPAAPADDCRTGCHDDVPQLGTRARLFAGPDSILPKAAAVLGFCSPAISGARSCPYCKARRSWRMSISS